MNATVVRRAQPWLGTIVSIEVPAEGDTADLAGAIAGAFAAVGRVHASMSPQCPGSDIARFNLARGGEVVPCDPWTIRVLRLAQRLKRASRGLFDVTLGTGGRAAYAFVRSDCVLKMAGDSRIDLGGIAKGFAVDRAVLALRKHGVARGLVNAGGDLRAFGTGMWPIVVRGADREIAARLSLERGAVATSEYRQGRSPHRNDPLIAPESGAVRAVDRTVTVAAPRCVLADALTKVVALSGDTHHPALRSLGGQAWLH